MKGCCKLPNSSLLIPALSGWINCPGDLPWGSAPPLTSPSSFPHLQARLAGALAPGWRGGGRERGGGHGGGLGGRDCFRTKTHTLTGHPSSSSSSLPPDIFWWGEKRDVLWNPSSSPNDGGSTKGNPTCCWLNASSGLVTRLASSPQSEKEGVHIPDPTPQMGRLRLCQASSLSKSHHPDLATLGSEQSSAQGMCVLKGAYSLQPG